MPFSSRAFQAHEFFSVSRFLLVAVSFETDAIPLVAVLDFAFDFDS